MPASTPNRGYPYPLPADYTNFRADMPRAIRNLAQAWDGDLTTADNLIYPRPTFRISSNQIQTVPVQLVPQFRVTFDSVDLNQSDAIDTSSLDFDRITEVTPSSAGFWYLTAAVVYGRPVGTPPVVDEISLSIMSGSTVIVRRNVHAMTTENEPRTLAVGTGIFLDGTTPISVEVFVNVIGTLRTYSVYDRSFTGFRMTGG